MAVDPSPWMMVFSDGVILQVMRTSAVRHEASGRRGRAFALAGAIALGCGDPPRPVFAPDEPAPDTVPPQVAVVAPAESVFAAGETIQIHVEVRDNVRVDAVSASVSGDLTFGWPAITPRDTVAFVAYALHTGSLIAGDLTFLVIAVDTAENRGSALRRFYVR